MNTTFIQRVTLPIVGFGCLGSGALIVERALLHVPGVIYAYVNAATEMAYVEYDAQRCTVATLREAVAHAGFQAGREVASQQRWDGNDVAGSGHTTR